MTTKQANAVWSILVKHVGAHDGEQSRMDFVQTQTQAKGCIEYRFQGSLGFGGKFRNYDDRWYVDCYRENETPDRMAAIEKANEELAALRARSIR